MFFSTLTIFGVNPNRLSDHTINKGYPPLAKFTTVSEN